MALNGWHWTIFGGIIAAVSAIVYASTNKSGEPNMSMALFFFIGIVFLIIGLLKLFFRRVDDSKVFEAAKRSEQDNSFQNIAQQPRSNSPMQNIPLQEPGLNLNKVDEAIKNIAKQHETKNHQAHQQERQQLHTGHSNSYARMHGYKGPVRPSGNTAAATHAQHQANAPQKIVNTTEHSLKCRKCGNVNHGHSNYCHQCGNRLK